MSPRSLSSLLALLILASPPAPVAGQAGEAPRTVEMDKAPVLRDVSRMEKTLQRFYPADLKDAGIEGAAEVWIRIDELGRVRDTRLKETSGYVALDEAAERVAGLMSFEPATRGGSAIAVWIPMNINFQEQPAAQRRQQRAEPRPRPQQRPEPMPEAERMPEPMSEPERRPQPERMPEPMSEPDESWQRPIPQPKPQQPALDAQPTFTPMTVRPQMQNAREVSAAMQEHYPPLLRDTGIGGTVKVWFFIDENGVVRKTQVSESSGYDALDRAALRVAETARFSPAQNRDEKVPVWVALDITFSTK